MQLAKLYFTNRTALKLQFYNV